MRKNKKNNIILILCLILFYITISISYVYSIAAEDNVIDEQAKSNEVRKIEDELNKHVEPNNIIEYNPHNLVGDISKGKFKFDFMGIVNKIFKYLFKEIYSNINVLIKLIILIILCAVLKNLQTSFLSDGVSELAFYACYVVIVTVLIISFNTAINLSRDIVDNMVNLMHATIPVLITLMMSSGNVTSSGIFQPLLIAIVQISGSLIKNVFIPLIYFSTILSIVNNISEKVNVSKLASLIRQITTWGLGLILTIFVAVISIQGSLGAVIDGVMSKTTKFAIGALIPVAGKYLADAADTVIGCSLLIRNGAGVAAMIGILAICIGPLLKIFALIILYRITCVLIEPISEKRITNCINDMAGSLTFVLGVAASAAVLFLLSITTVIAAGNISAMMR